MIGGSTRLVAGHSRLPRSGLEVTGGQWCLLRNLEPHRALRLFAAADLVGWSGADHPQHVHDAAAICRIQSPVIDARRPDLVERIDEHLVIVEPALCRDLR